MTRALTLTHNAYMAARQRQTDLASSTIVLACGAALIFAGQPLPL